MTRLNLIDQWKILPSGMERATLFHVRRCHGPHRNWRNTHKLDLIQSDNFSHGLQGSCFFPTPSLTSKILSTQVKMKSKTSIKSIH